MKIYWSYNSIPELADIPKEKRKEIWKPCSLKCLASWPFCVSAIAMIVVWFILVKLGFFYSDNHTISSIWALIVTAIVGFILKQVELALLRPYIRKYLNLNEQTNRQSF
jgi:RsiW-degrading membrane proteinase PrsW (M82 family)